MLLLTIVAVHAVALECGSIAYEDGFDEGAFEVLENDAKSGWKCEMRDGSWFKFGVYNHAKAPCTGTLYLVRSDGRRFKATCRLVKPGCFCERVIEEDCGHGKYACLEEVDFESEVYQLLDAVQVEEKAGIKVRTCIYQGNGSKISREQPARQHEYFGALEEASSSPCLDKLCELYFCRLASTPQMPFELMGECECYVVNKQYTWHRSGRTYMLLELERASELYGSSGFVRLIAVDITSGQFKKVFDRESLASHSSMYWVPDKSVLSYRTKEGLFELRLEVDQSKVRQDKLG